MSTQKKTNEAGNSVQYFEYLDEKSAKFWEITVEATRVIVRYGKIGTTGQSQIKEFENVAAAAAHSSKLVYEKLAKGYQTSKANVASGTKVPTTKIEAEPKTDPPSKQDAKPQSSPKVKVTRSAEVKSQIKAAKALQQKIIEETTSLFPDVFKPKMADSDARGFLDQIQLSAESFDVEFEAVDCATVNRTASMLSGPFFTSKKFPIPVGAKKKEMLYPIVQVDLRTASALLGENLGDGLLQLWYDVNAFAGVVRLVPRSELTVDKELAFEFIPAKDFSGFPLPYGWGSDPLGEEVLVMSSYKSTGMSTQAEYPEIYLNDVDVEYEVPKSLFKLVEKFNQIANDESSSAVHMFGTFYPIQYSAADVGCKCLFHIKGDWGSSGNAQVFYKIDKNDVVTFQFRDSLR